MAQHERRRHPRHAARLGMCIHLDQPGETTPGRTLDLAAGGVRCLLFGRRPNVGDRVEMELTIPAGHGHWPHAGTVTGRGTVLRCEAASADDTGNWAAALRFDEPLQLQFA